MKDLKIDPELRDLLPALTDEEFKKLEKNIVDNGFDRNFPIMAWNGFIADGHNRYTICKKHNITPAIGTLAYETKDEVMEWMLDIQLGRRNLSPIQRIAVAEKYRPIYERQAKENISKAVSESNKNRVNPTLVNLPNMENKTESINTSEKLAAIADVSEKTYRMGAKILQSDDEQLKQEVLSGQKSISAGYKELTQSADEPNSAQRKKNKNETQNRESNSISNCSNQEQVVSEETKQICADLKTEKSKEYLDSIWDYKIAIIESMNVGFSRFYDGFVSILNDMDGRVTKSELEECIKNAETKAEKLLTAIELAKNTKLKMEDK